MQGEQSLYNNDARGTQHLGPRDPRMGGEVVHRQMHGFVVAQAGNLLDDEFVIEGLGRVEIYPRSFLQSQMREVPIVAVQRQHAGMKRSSKMCREVGFSRT